MRAFLLLFTEKWRAIGRCGESPLHWWPLLYFLSSPSFSRAFPLFSQQTLIRQNRIHQNHRIFILKTACKILEPFQFIFFDTLWSSRLMCWKWKRLIPPMGQNSGILDTVLKLLFEMHLSLSLLILLFNSLEQCSFNKQQWSLIGLMFCPRSPTSCWLSTQAPILLSTVGRWEIGLRQRGKGGSVLLTIPMGISSITHFTKRIHLSSFNKPLLPGREIPRCLPGNSGLSESISYFRLSSGEIRFFLRKVHASTLYSSVANDNSVLLFVYLCICIFDTW